MQAISLGLVPGEDIDAFWRRVAQRCMGWLDEQRLPPRDAVLLLPFAQQIVPARRAFAALAGWAPLITTSHSLASSLGPTRLAAPGQLSGDAAIDAFTADELLSGQSWAQALRARDDKAYVAARARLVETAHALARAAAQHAPAERSAFFSAVTQRLTLQAGGPGDLERALGLVALAWVQSDDRAPATDALFTLNPSAWLVLEVGGPDALARALGAAQVPALCLRADVDLDAVPATGIDLQLAACADFETLAEQTATSVLQHLNAGRAPVALLAQDRVAVRRVRTLLLRQRVPIHDETGWTLATTPAAAALMALLRAQLAQGGVDDWLAWMKSPLGAGFEAAALRDLEALCRRKGWRDTAALDALGLPLWREAREAAAPLAGGPRKLGGWLADLGRALRRLGPLAEVEGGGPLLDALWISRNPWAGSAHEQVIGATRLRADEFLAWVDATLEAAQFSPPEDAQPAVIVTPLARALLRPFGAAVLPGVDAATLAAAPPRNGVLSDADAVALGLPHLAAQREAQAWGFAQLLRLPAVTLLRCSHAGAEPLPPSPLVERLEAAWGRPLPAWVDARAAVALARRPAHRHAATPQRLPARLSASSIEALRNCPYRFFSRSLLGLREPDELDTELDKRDYGTWLHAVLRRFHDARSGDDPADLRAAADAEAAGLDAADFLPFRAAFERVLPRYLQWLAATEGEGQRFEAGEVERRCQPFDGPLAALTLDGRIDRIDTTPAGRLLLDYKTGRAEDLKDRLKTPLEDTQLAVYALLMDADPALQAAYLAMDEPEALVTVPHPEVSVTAQVLRDGLQADLSAVLAGQPLPALGEGRVCDHCEARGLCRKDDLA
ncbi:MAG: PD-(D/E)XK nuclease family protein [Burkholderiales bacterium]|uniref:PD-(D/E)XK nuclease family protein n=2 Tax=Pseudomonadota TaxID=1224 RepID=UPI000FA91AD7|nr:MAG: PD-(D/E)XK nuclease family protein [Burkholderiales bacterium]